MPVRDLVITLENNIWLEQKINGDSFQSKSDIVNNLIESARTEAGKIDRVRAALRETENSQYMEIDPEVIKQEIKSDLRANGKIKHT